MATHSAFLDRMGGRLDQLELQLGDLAAEARGELAPMLQVQRERLAELRRLGAEVTTEATQSFAAAVERLALRLGEAKRQAA
jgi:hypothetical protein